MNNIININNKLAIKEILELNDITSKKDLSLTYKDTLYLIKNKNNILKDIGRIEVGSGIIKKIIYTFYDSPYIDKYNYLKMLLELINIFYLYQDKFSYILIDEQLLKYMRKCFDTECAGSWKLLESVSFNKLNEYLEEGKIYE